MNSFGKQIRVFISQSNMGLVYAAVFLSIIGLLVIYSVTFDRALDIYQDSVFYVKRHLIGLAAGSIVAVMLAYSDYRKLKRFTVFFLMISLAAMIGSLIFFSTPVDDQGLVGPASFASEMLKLATIIYVAHWIATKSEYIHDLTYGLVPFSVIVGVSASFLVLRPALSEAAILTIIAFGLFFVGGGDLRQFAIAGFLGGAIFLFLVATLPHAAARIDSFSVVLTDPTGSVGEYYQSVFTALGSGGLFGKGLGIGVLSQDYLSSPHTYSVFASLTEELGWLGGFMVIGLFAILCYRGLRVANNAPDSFGMILAIGLTFSLMISATLNLASNVALIPYIASPLPFISYGESTMFFSMIMIGILLSVSKITHKKEISTRSKLNRGQLRLSGLRFVPGSHWLLILSSMVLIAIILFGNGIGGLLQDTSVTDELQSASSGVVQRVLSAGRIIVILISLLITTSIMLFRTVFRQYKANGIIERQLEINGQVSNKELGPFGKTFLNQYEKTHRDLDLVLDTLGVLRYRRINLKKESDTLWRRISQSLVHNSHISEELSRELISTFQTSLGLSSETPKLSEQDNYYVSLMDTLKLFSNLPIPEQIPIIVPKYSILDEHNWLEMPRYARKLFRASKNIVVVLAWTKELYKDPAINLLHQVYAFDMITLGETELRQYVVARNSQNHFRQSVLRGINLSTISPFVTSGSTPELMFFGRENELREIVVHASTNSYAVIGGRRIGKTSLLNRLYHRRLPAAGFCTVYQDCSSLRTFEDFFKCSIRDWQPERPSRAPKTFGELIRDMPVLDKVIVLLDEADKLVPQDQKAGWPLFSSLRSAINTGNIRIVLGGERTLRKALRNPESPLFNMVDEILLRPLDYEDTRELITRPMKQLEINLVDEDAIVDRIWEFTSGHPNVIQRLCSRLLMQLNEQIESRKSDISRSDNRKSDEDRATFASGNSMVNASSRVSYFFKVLLPENEAKKIVEYTESELDIFTDRKITVEDVDTVIKNPGFQRDDFLGTFWESATLLEKIISLIMADDEEIRSLRSIREALMTKCRIKVSAREVDEALQMLVDLRSILKRTVTGYDFAIEAFPRVVSGTMTLEDMLQIFVEEYGEQIS